MDGDTKQYTMTVKEVAALTGESERYITAIVDEGHPDHLVCQVKRDYRGRRIRFAPDDVHAWVASHVR